MNKNSKIGIFPIVVFILIIIGISVLLEKNLILGIILISFIIIAIIAMLSYLCYKYYKQKEKEEQALAAAIRRKEKEKQALTQALQKREQLVEDTIFENNELVKVILNNDTTKTIENFFYQVLLCDKLKKYNKKYVFDDNILIFNGYQIKYCKMENLKISVVYIDMSSYCFFYNSSNTTKYGINRDSICIGKNGFIKHQFFISKENRELLENHINKLNDDLYKYRGSINTFIGLKKFDYKNFFENETMNKIIETLTKDIHFYNEIKNDIFNFLDTNAFVDYYISLEKKYEKWKKEREKSIHHLLQQLNMFYEEKYTAENSVLCSKLMLLNQEYKNEESSAITQVCKQHIFQIECKTKTEFDRFDFNKKVIDEIRKNTFYYYSFSEVIKEAGNSYECYIEKYNNLKKAYSVKKNSYNFEIAYTQFKYNENKLFKNNKMLPPIYPTMKIKLHYTTPSSRYSYATEMIFEYEEILTLIEKSKELSESELKKQEMKKLRDKVRLLEEQIKQMQQGQIYSIQHEEQAKSFKENNSISTSLIYYRTLFENGEITREEYEQKRKELMG